MNSKNIIFSSILFGCFSIFCARNYYKHLIYGSDKRGGEILTLKT